MIVTTKNDISEVEDAWRLEDLSVYELQFLLEKITEELSRRLVKPQTLTGISASLSDP